MQRLVTEIYSDSVTLVKYYTFSRWRVHRLVHVQTCRISPGYWSPREHSASWKIIAHWALQLRKICSWTERLPPLRLVNFRLRRLFKNHYSGLSFTNAKASWVKKLLQNELKMTVLAGHSVLSQLYRRLVYTVVLWGKCFLLTREWMFYNIRCTGDEPIRKIIH